MRVHGTIDTSPIALTPGELTKPMDLGGLFGAGRPVELEIGMGKGTFLVQEASLRPEAGFLGLELDRKIHDYAADRMRRRGLANVRTHWGDAAAFVREHLEPSSLAAIRVYFPDPWPKKRHRKRRLLQPAFLALLEGLLVPGGLLHIASDHADYAAQIAEGLATTGLLVEPYEPPLAAGPGEAVGTNFERKYRRRDGRSTYVFARRKPGSAT